MFYIKSNATQPHFVTLWPHESMAQLVEPHDLKDLTKRPQYDLGTVQDKLHEIVGPVFKKNRIRPKCLHGKTKQGCKVCTPQAFCDHNRRKRSCSDCGSVIKKIYIPLKCPHGKTKSNCKDCSPDYYCKHNRHKYTCVECAGSAICEHGRRRRDCVQCQGTGICQHNRHKNTCVDCVGSAICVHNKRRSICRDCNGRQICEHSLRRSTCHDCNGNQICVHKRYRSRCQDCVKCHIHMCENRVTKSIGSTSAYKWQVIEGCENPTTGNEIHNELLAAALLQKVDFNNADLDSFQQDFFYDDYIKVNNLYYIPAGTCSGCARDERRSRIAGGEKKLHYWLHKQGVTLIRLTRTAARKKKRRRSKTHWISTTSNM